MKYKTIFLSGGTGSWANELVEQFLNMDDDKKPSKIIIFSRGELAQVTMTRKFKNLAIKNNIELEFVIGDVRDYDAVLKATREVDLIFHLAAIKHVPLAEQFPEEAIKTNITGTLNMIKAAIENRVEKFVDVSTDKAVESQTFYGYTKAIAESLTIKANDDKQNITKFVCVRGGNVIGSNGSVVPLFIKQITDNNEITITNPKMTRFFISLKEAITLLINAAYDDNINNGEILVIKMKSIKMKDLSTLLINEYGDDNTKVKQIPERENEKIHEVLISNYESDRTSYYKDNYFCIYRNKDILKGEKVNFQSYSSGDTVCSLPEAYNLLREAGYMTKKKIAILGSKGMLGHVLYEYLKEKGHYDIIAYDRDNYNFICIENINDFCEDAKKENFDFIINCMGKLIKSSENDSTHAGLINTELPKTLESSFSNTSTKIIHISTDCVFKGVDDNSKFKYDEDCVPDGTSAYSMTKARGEINNNKDLTIRTSIIGPELKENGEGLFDWFFKQTGEVQGYRGHLWNGLTVLQLSSIIERCLFDNSLVGIKHFYSPNVVSKYELLNMINHIFKWNKDLKEVTTVMVNKTLTTKKDNEIYDSIPSLELQVFKLMEFIRNNQELYNKDYINE